MNRETISKAVGGISDRHVSEAAVYTPADVSGGPERIKIMKTRTHRRAAIAAIAAAACLALSVAAYASGMFWQNYNWKGDPVGGPYPEITVSQDEVIETRPSETVETMQAIIDDRADRELVIVRDGESSRVSDRSENVASIEELREKLAAEDSPLRASFAIPEGYALTGGYVAYDATDGYFLVSSEERPDGLVVQRYTAPPENDFISLYRLDYENAAGDRIFIFAEMSADSNYSFSSPDSAAVKAIAVAGMDEALLQQSGETAVASMLAYLDAPVVCFDKGWLSYRTPPGEETEMFTEVYYMCYASHMDADGLLEVLAPFLEETEQEP